MDAPFHRSRFNKPLTYKALRRLALALGWIENKTQGKGSHRAFTRNGYREITLPCHSENHEYQRGQTRQFLKQILEPLADVCQVPVQGVHSVEQVETIVQELLEYLPVQVQQEYERAIADQKAELDIYTAEKKITIDQSLQDYEAQRLQECDNIIHELQAEQHLDGSANYILHQALLLSEQENQSIQAKIRTLQSTQQNELVQYDLTHQELREVKHELGQQETLVEQLHQSLQRDRQKIQRLQKRRKRDRFLILGFIGLSVCLSIVLVQRESTRPRSPNSMLIELQAENEQQYFVYSSQK